MPTIATFAPEQPGPRMRAFSKILSFLLLLSIFLSTNHRLIAGLYPDKKQNQIATPLHVDNCIIIQTLNAVLLNPLLPSGKEQIVFGCINSSYIKQLPVIISGQKISSRSSFGDGYFILLTRLPGEAVYFLSKILI